MLDILPMINYKFSLDQSVGNHRNTLRSLNLIPVWNDRVHKTQPFVNIVNLNCFKKI